MGYMNHDEPYSDDYIKDILSSVKTIAMVGASPDKTKFSYGVLRVLHETGYDIIQKQGQRIFGGPPPGWAGPPPGRGTEIYCYRIPRFSFFKNHKT